MKMIYQKTKCSIYISEIERKFSAHLRKLVTVLALLGCISLTAYSQTTIDFSVGSSFQDNISTQLSVRHQFANRFRAGLELQYGLPTYRFVGAQPIREGYAISTSIPMTFQISAREDKMQLYGIGRVGARFQGIIDPDGNDMQDSILNSTAVLFEMGMMANFDLGKRYKLQSGISFPVAYEVAPEAIFEYNWIRLHLGQSYAFSEKMSAFLHGNFGHAWGASGDSYKLIWSVEAGVRLSVGAQKNSTFQFIESSF